VNNLSIDKPEVSEFESVDPAPPSHVKDIHLLGKILVNEDEKMFQRMRALFALRGIGGAKSVDALAAAFSSNSALLKHEIAYVMGQMQDNHALPYLIDRLEDTSENLMVRHEAAEALGAIGDMTALKTLKKFVNDSEPVISESCEVALDLLDWVASKRLEYTN
jgi:deoxyhypusine monooxygenase